MINDYRHQQTVKVDAAMTNLGTKIEKHLNTLMDRYPVLKSCCQDISDAYVLMKDGYERHGKLLIAGNGGSAADSEHIAGELMKRFRLPRPVSKEVSERLKEIDSVRGTALAEKLERALPAIPLVALEALSTAYGNDVDGSGVFAQQLFALGCPGDVFLGISTSGNSKNVILAAIVAKALGIKVIGLTGVQGGELASFSDVAVKVPMTETYRIQELHLPIYHCWCLMLEERFFGDPT
jgi:D-sedoheptulose 7-phosphate isomerase